MQRKFRYALAAGLLSSGAPAGLLGIRLVQHPNHSLSLRHVRTAIAADRTAYMYVGGATAVIFALFGYILGRQADQLAALSETDALTGLYNARGFSPRLCLEVKRARRYAQPLSVLFLDVDGLKTLNDSHGHRAGSEGLRQVANVIRREVRNSDIAARWGGDEFVIVAPMTSRDAALGLADRIRSRIGGRTGSPALTASIGVATHDPEDAAIPADAALLMRAADTAMYAAKKRGRNAVAHAESAAMSIAAQA
jgi:diguanylate cyclase (GGDEF)-like protein